MEEKRTRKKFQKEVHTLIVGFGFSVITLLRELEKSGHDYTLISEGKTIWEHLHDKDKLHFDLVSSYHTSVLTEDQVKDAHLEDFFPTAHENYDYHQRIMAPFRDKVTRDRVVSVDNHPDRSIVYCQSGTIYKAINVVFATGLSRPQNNAIKNLDLSTTQGKTVVFDMIGDTTNMMCSWLVPQGNKVILLNNGFVALDKVSQSLDILILRCHAYSDALPCKTYSPLTTLSFVCSSFRWKRPAQRIGMFPLRVPAWVKDIRLIFRRWRPT